MYLKKLTSLHPTKYEYIKIDKAFDEYSQYLINCIQRGYNKKELKTFSQWLATEI